MKIKTRKMPYILNPMNPLQNNIKIEKRKTYYIGLNGCLSEYSCWDSKDSIGHPIPEMKKWILYFLKKGIKIKIFTARANKPELIPPIRKWLLLNGFPLLEITNIKGLDCDMIFDNNAREVINNVGVIVNLNNEFNREKRDSYLKKLK